MGSWPEAVAIGDVTGDGRNDVVMTTSYYFDEANDFRLWVFAQAGDGSLAPPVSYATAATYTNQPESVAVGDITGDGKADVVVGIAKLGVQLFPQLASGSLGAPTMTATANSRKIRLGHLNADAHLDVAGAGPDTGSVSVLLNDGAGELRPPVSYTARYAGSEDLEVGDVTGDGRADLVVMAGSGTPDISVLAQQADGTFGPAAEYVLDWYDVQPNGIGLGDVDGDGRNDVAVSAGGNQPDSVIAYFFQTAAGTLDPLPMVWWSYDIPEPIEIADLDRDGRNDVVTLHGGWSRAGVYLQHLDNAGFAPQELYPIPYASHYNRHGLAIGDVNGDGAPDIVIADYNNGLVVLRNALVSAPPPPSPPPPPPPPPRCENGVDDDGDGLVDWPADPGCVDRYDDDEYNAPPPPQCENGIDDDGDGAVDWLADPGCVDRYDDDEYNLPLACENGIDDDGDGLVDWPADPGCLDRYDGDEYNPPPVVDTGFRSPSASSADSGGDGNGFQTNPSGAHADDSAYAVDTNSGSGTSTSCTSTGKDRHRFRDYGFALPAGASIKGIEVRLDARVDSTSGSPRMCAQLSEDGGASWTSAKTTATLTTAQATHLLGSATDTWGRTWSATSFGNAGFRVRVIDVASSTSRDFSLDWVAVKIHHTG